MSDQKSRRDFLTATGAAAVGLALGLNKDLSASESKEEGVFGSQFLQKGRVIELPAGYYDADKKVFIRKDNGMVLVEDEQLTGSWTYSDTTRCTNMFYPNEGAPSCSAYDTDQDQHPDGFKPGE